MATRQAAATAQQKAQEASVAAEHAKTQASADEAAVAVAEERHAWRQCRPIHTRSGAYAGDIARAAVRCTLQDGKGLRRDRIRKP